MQRKQTCTALMFLVLVSFGAGCLACTTFVLRDGGELVFARNYDWSVEEGLVITNKRGVVKTAIGVANPAQWQSRYGSITFNQYGRELPMGGMNEAGLVLECMWLSQSVYPEPDDRPELIELQWIQYQLDTASSVKEVLASDSVVRISRGSQAPIHFLVCDRQGDRATVEFLEGKLVAHYGDDLPAAALTNNTYSECRAFLARIGDDEEGEAFQGAQYSLKRYYWAAKGIERFDSKSSGSAVDHAFAVLKKASVDVTQWSIVYDLAKERIYFQTLSNPERHCLDVGTFDFSCKTPVRILDMLTAGPGNVTKLFAEYTPEKNLGLIQAAHAKTEFLKDLPPAFREQSARYPDTTRCSK